MPVMQQAPDDHPLMVAWNAYKASDNFANSRKWATSPEHIDGSLWAAFMAGFIGRHAQEEQAKADNRPTEKGT